MKKHLSLFLSLTVATACGQGLVNFANTPSTPVYISPLVYPPQPNTIMSGPPGSYYFGLFLGIPGQNFTFTGIYATNTGVDGLFSGGVVAVPGWAPGTSQSYSVAGWSAGMGHVFRPYWLDGVGITGNFGLTGVGTGIAGDGSSIPTLNLFDGGGNTLQMEFQLYNNVIPEPSSTALAGLALTALICFRRARKFKSRALESLISPRRRFAGYLDRR